jgi:hypothetical protein
MGQIRTSTRLWNSKNSARREKQSDEVPPTKPTSPGAPSTTAGKTNPQR